MAPTPGIEVPTRTTDVEVLAGGPSSVVQREEAATDDGGSTAPASPVSELLLASSVEVVQASRLGDAAVRGNRVAPPNERPPSRPAAASTQLPIDLQRRPAVGASQPAVLAEPNRPTSLSTRTARARGPPLAATDHLPVQRTGCGGGCGCGPCSEDEKNASAPPAPVQRARTASHGSRRGGAAAAPTGTICEGHEAAPGRPLVGHAAQRKADGAAPVGRWLSAVHRRRAGQAGKKPPGGGAQVNEQKQQAATGAATSTTAPAGGAPGSSVATPGPVGAALPVPASLDEQWRSEAQTSPLPSSVAGAHLSAPPPLTNVQAPVPPAAGAQPKATARATATVAPKVTEPPAGGVPPQAVQEAPPAVKPPMAPTIEGPEGEATNSTYAADEGDVLQADAVDEGKIAALGGAVEGRAGILSSAEAEAEALRQEAADEQRAQDELAASPAVQRKAAAPAEPAAGGGGGDAEPAGSRGAAEPAAASPGLEATAADEGAIRAEAGAEFSGLSAGAKEWSPKGGGGGGSPVVSKPAPPIPNVAGREPAAAVSALAGLPPAQILGAIGGVAAAASTAVGKKEKALAAAPPTKRIAEGPPGPGATPPKPSLEAKVEEVKPNGGKEPDVKAGEETVEAPPLVLAGETDPANVTAQEAAGKAAATAAGSGAKAGLAAPRGEEKLNPKVKAQTVKPQVPAASGKVDVAPEAVGEEESSIVALQEKPGELHSAVAKGSGELSKASADAAKKEAEQKKESDGELKKAEADHAKELKEEQAKGRKAVAKERKEAESKQSKLLSSHSKEASAKKAEAITKVKTEKVKGDAEANKEVRAANTKIASEKRKGEEKARKAEEEERKKDSGGGVWGAIKRGASAVVSAVKSAVKAVVDAVKSAVKSIVSAVVSVVASVLKGVWSAIKSVVTAALDVLKKLASAFLDALKALVDAALALIDSLIKAALAALQALANLLPGILGKLLGALVSALKAVYDALKAAYKAAIEAIKSAVKAVVSWAKSAIAAFGMLAALIKDIAAAPGRWFSNLLSSAKDGIMNHLWGALKTAVKAWWDGKVQGLIGAPQQVLALLMKGGISLAMVLGMAWEAIKAALPELIIQQLIEKVISALNVGAGTVLLLLRTLQAAWGSISAIVGAIQKFVGFLKAVKGGGAGPQFATAVAAGAVAVIEFVSNFLMARLGSKLKPLKDKLGALAKKIGQKLLGVAKKIGGKIVKAAKAALAKVRSKLGKMFGRRAPKGRQQKGSPSNRPDRRDKAAERRRKKEERERQRKDRAFASAEKTFRSLLQRGASLLRLKATALWLKARHRFHRMSVVGSGDQVTVEAGFSPSRQVAKAIREQIADAWQRHPDAYEITYVRVLKKSPSTLGSLMTTGQRLELVAMIRRGLRESGQPATTAAAQMLAKKVLSAKITVILGTPKIRMLYKKIYKDAVGTAIGEVHHLIPLYLGGTHEAANLIDLGAKLHDDMHRLFDRIGSGSEFPSLSPNTLRAMYGSDAKYNIAVISETGHIKYEQLLLRNG